MRDVPAPGPTLHDDGYEFSTATDDYSVVGDPQDATCLHQSILWKSTYCSNAIPTPSYISFPLKAIQVHDLQVQLALAFGPSDIKDEVVEPPDHAEPVDVAGGSGSKGGSMDKKRVLSRRDLWLHSPPIQA